MSAIRRQQRRLNVEEAAHTDRLAGRRVLVTGAGTGIGRGIAIGLAREGADVALHYGHSADGALSAAEEIRRMGRRAAVFQADFTDVAAVKGLAGEATAFLGGLDGLVNNAGITMNMPFEKVTPEQFDTLYTVNVRSPFFLTQAALPALVETGGAIVNITSIHAFEGYPEHAVYAGTKGAIVSTTRELAIELALKGVRVNAVAPGSVVVDNYFKADPTFDPAAAGAVIPCGFIGEPVDIAHAVVFLLSPEARFIVGQTLIVDGGTSSWMPFGDGFRRPGTAQFGKGYVPGLER
jgi:NAD(P)-dependent dehydrogenase (short-subunit alcohol dehydrogenase family)